MSLPSNKFVDPNPNKFVYAAGSGGRALRGQPRVRLGTDFEGRLGGGRRVRRWRRRRRRVAVALAVGAFAVEAVKGLRPEDGLRPLYPRP